MDKKALIAFNMLIWVPRIIIAVAALVAVSFVLFYVVSVTFSTEGEEMGLVIDRLLYSPTGISYYDPITNRVMPGIIDIQKLKSNEWKSSVEAGSYFAIRINLTKDDHVLYNGTNDEAEYKKWKPMEKIPGSVISRHKTVYVLAEEDNKLVPMWLGFNIITPKK